MQEPDVLWLVEANLVVGLADKDSLGDERLVVKNNWHGVFLSVHKLGLLEFESEVVHLGVIRRSSGVVAYRSVVDRNVDKLVDNVFMCDFNIDVD